MALQCIMCSEILVNGEELAGADLPGILNGRKGWGVAVHPGCCPECFGLATEGALRIRASERQAAAA